MPTYEYKCPKCQFIMHMSHSMSSNPEVYCIHCSSDMQRGIGGGLAVHFKGTGFYETDYKGK